MRTVFYFGGFAPVGGIETAARNMLCGLSKYGIELSLVCWGARTRLIEEVEEAGVHVCRVSWRWGCRLGLPDWILLLTGAKVVKDADVVLFGKFVPRSILKVLRGIVGPATRFVLITPYRPQIAGRGVNRDRVLRLYDDYDCIWVQAELFRTDLRELGYRKPVEVVPYLPESTREPPAFPEGAIRVGFLGRLVEDKDLPLLLAAFAAFCGSHEGPGIGDGRATPRLEIFGDGPLRRPLQDLASRGSPASSITFHGAISQSEVREAVGRCHVFVFTSKREGQCLAALEILGCGRPVVATSVGAFPEILSDARLGRVVLDARPESIAWAIGEVVRDVASGGLTPEIVQKAYQERFDALVIGNHYAQLLRGCGTRAE